MFEPEQGNSESFKPVALVKTSTQHPQGEIYHIHTDHLGTPQEVSNEAGEVIWAAQYRAYGAVKRQLEVAGSDVNGDDQPDPSFTLNLRFMGQYFDQETGLNYNRHRYYDPECGQFTTQDPIGSMGGLNNYQYVPNPVSWVDLLGLCEKEIYSFHQNEMNFYKNLSDRSKNLSSRNLDLNVNERGLLDQERSLTRESGWKRSDGSAWWPPCDGAITGTNKFTTLMPNKMLDKFGPTSGTYLSDADASLESRALSSVPLGDPMVYKVLKPISEVEKAKIASLFDQPGLGTQYKISASVQDYLNTGFLE